MGTTEAKLYKANGNPEVDYNPDTRTVKLLWRHATPDPVSVEIGRKHIKPLIAELRKHTGTQRIA